MKECPSCSAECKPDETECPQCGADFAYLAEKIAEKEAAAAKIKEKAEKKKLRKKRIIERLAGLIKKMDDNQLISLLEKANDIFEKKDRTHPRLDCLVQAEYVIQNKAYQDYIKDISMGGAFIETSEKFDEGQDITMTLSLSHHVKPFKVIGKVARSMPDGIGVKFVLASQVQEELIKTFVDKVEEFRQK